MLKGVQNHDRLFCELIVYPQVATLGLAARVAGAPAKCIRVWPGEPVLPRRKTSGARRCVPTQQDGSSTGRHSVFDVKLFTHLGSRAALSVGTRGTFQPGRRVDASRYRACLVVAPFRGRGSRQHSVKRNVKRRAVPCHAALCRAEDERTTGTRSPRNETSPGTGDDSDHDDDGNNDDDCGHALATAGFR